MFHTGLNFNCPQQQRDSLEALKMSQEKPHKCHLQEFAYLIANLSGKQSTHT